MLAKTMCALLLALATGQDWMRWNPTPTPPPASDRAPAEAKDARVRIVVIRNRNVVGMALKYKIVLDGEPRGRIGVGRYMTLEATPGRHRIDVGCFGGWTPTAKVASAYFDANADETRYFLVHADANCAGIEELPPRDGEPLRAKAKEMRAEDA